MATLKMGSTTVLTDTTLANAVQDNVTRLGTVTAGTLGSSVVFPPGMMRFVTEVYTNTADQAAQAGQVVTTGALSVTIGSKIMLQCSITYEDQVAGNAYHAFYLTGDTNSGCGAGTSGTLIGGEVEYEKSTNERGAFSASHTYITATATPTYGVFTTVTGSPNIAIHHSNLTVFEIYQ